VRIEYKGDRVSMSKNEYGQVMNEFNQYKQAYQHCVDDLIVLRANNKRLERVNNKLKQSVSEYKDYAESHVANYLEFRALEEENKVLRLQEKTYFDECQNAKKELKDYQDDYEMVTNNCIYWEDKARYIGEEYEKLYELLQDFSKFINYKLIVSPASDTYKHYRSKLDQLGVK